MAVTGTVSLPSISGIGIPVTAFLDDAHDSVMIVDSAGVAKLQRVSRGRRRRENLGRDGSCERRAGHLERAARH